MAEVIALMEEFGTSVLQPGAVVGIAVTVILFILEVRWSHAHPPHSRRVEKAVALGHVVTAKRIKYWDDGVTPDEKTTSHYHTWSAPSRRCRSSCTIWMIPAEHSAAKKSEADSLKFSFSCSPSRWVWQ